MAPRARARFACRVGAVFFSICSPLAAWSQEIARPQPAPLVGSSALTAKPPPNASLTSCGPDYCGVRGQSVLEGWYYPLCGSEDCGKETWFINGVPSFATATIKPPVTTGDQSTVITLAIAADAPLGITRGITLGAHCTGEKVNCLTATVSLLVQPEIKCATTGHVVCPSLWWFNGTSPQPPFYQTKLEATSGGKDYSWTITSGTQYAQFSNKSATIDTHGTNTVDVLPNNDPGNGAPPTVAVTVAVKTDTGTVTSKPFTLTVRKPYELFPKSVAGHASDATNVVDLRDATFGYESDIHYEIRDQNGDVLPFPVPLNEHFTSGLINDYPGTNWRFPDNCGPTHFCSGNYPPTNWYDQVQGEAVGHGFVPPPMVPGTPLGNVKVDHWNGTWGIGDGTPGKGVTVQTNTWQKWQDHARHTNVVSPP